MRGTAVLLRSSTFRLVVLAAAAFVYVTAETSLAILAVLAIGLWGLAFTTVPVCLQSSVLNTPRADPDRASAIYVITFQVAIASGTLVGGVLIDRSSLAVVTATAAVLVAAALLVVVLSRSMFPQSPHAETTLAGFNNR